MDNKKIINSESLRSELNMERKKEGKTEIPAINNRGGVNTSTLARKDKSYGNVLDFFRKMFNYKRKN